MSKASVILSQQNETIKKDKTIQILQKKIFGDLLLHKTIKCIPNIVTRRMVAKHSKTLFTVFKIYTERWLRLFIAYNNKKKA